MNENQDYEELEELESIPDFEVLSDDSVLPDDDLPELEEVYELLEPGQPDVSKKTKNSRRLPPLMRLSRRAIVFLSFTLLANILFFMTGNRQSFLDSNLSLILKIIACNSIALSFFTAFSCLECVFYIVKTRKLRMVILFLVYLLIFAVSLVLSCLSMSINLLSDGIYSGLSL